MVNIDNEASLGIAETDGGEKVEIWNDPDTMDLLSGGSEELKDALGKSIPDFLSKPPYSNSGRIRNEWQSGFEFFIEALSLSREIIEQGAGAEVGGEIDIVQRQLYTALPWGAQMTAYDALEKMEAQAVVNSPENDGMKRVSKALKLLHFSPLLSERYGISIAGIMDNPMLLADKQIETYEFISGITKTLLNMNRGYDDGHLPVELSGILLFARIEPFSFDFTKMEPPLKNAARYAQRATEAFRTARESIFNALSDSSHPKHTALRERILADFSLGDEAFENHMYRFLFLGGDAHQFYRKMRSLADQNGGEENLYEKLLKKSIEITRQELPGYVLEVQDLPIVVDIVQETEEVGPLLDATKIDVVVSNAISQGGLQDVMNDVDLQSVMWKEVAMPAGATFKIERQNGHEVKVIFEVTYPQDPKKLQFLFVRSGKGFSFDWTILDDPANHPQEVRALSRVGVKILEAYLREAKRREASASKPAVVLLNNVPVGIEHSRKRGGNNGNQQGNGVNVSTGEGERSETTTGEVQQKRKVVLPEAFKEKLKNKPKPVRRRIYSKIRDVTRGSYIKPLTHEDGLTEDGRQQFEARSGPYRIIFASAGRDADGVPSIEGKDINWRRDMAKPKSARAVRKRK